MRIDWAALGVVAVVSVVASVVFVIFLSAGIRIVTAARERLAHGRSNTAELSLGYGMLAAAGLLVLFGIYLIVPQFH